MLMNKKKRLFRMSVLNGIFFVTVLYLLFESSLQTLNVVIGIGLIVLLCALSVFAVNFLLWFVIRLKVKKQVISKSFFSVAVTSLGCVLMIVIWLPLLNYLLVSKTRDQIRNTIEQIDKDTSIVKINDKEVELSIFDFFELRILTLGTIESCSLPTENTVPLTISDSKTTLKLILSQNPDSKGEYWVYYPKKSYLRKNAYIRFRLTSSFLDDLELEKCFVNSDAVDI